MNREAKNTRGLMLVSSIISIVLAVIGIVMILSDLGNFGDKSYRVMIGIGFIVGSILIFGLSRAVGMAQMRKEEGKGKVEN
ncbi:hypothetical protein [Saccharibacillus kuerlensis]|uniref:Uncharacterized protein n=1 Tax=Saccharibacillus kuerlensis TaxID=459527 RepID=A0ABQ2L9R3_9BACL|nr:hypothetical protein [Saccharibacillus kuerlensis]GGO07883.1 hypothetical protein GCM10010969_36720 [Saccharibacillus kuerlensis]